MPKPSCTIHLVSANLGRLLGPYLPETVAAAARASLRRTEVARRLRGSWVLSIGDDLHLHLTTAASDFPDSDPAAFAARAAWEAAAAALVRGRELGLRGALDKPDPTSL